MSIFENTPFYTHNFAQDQPYTAHNHAVLQTANRKQHNTSPVALRNGDSTFTWGCISELQSHLSSTAPAGGTTRSSHLRTPRGCRNCLGLLVSVPSKCYKSFQLSDIWIVLLTTQVWIWVWIAWQQNHYTTLNHYSTLNCCTTFCFFQNFLSTDSITVLS